MHATSRKCMTLINRRDTAFAGREGKEHVILGDMQKNFLFLLKK